MEMNFVLKVKVERQKEMLVKILDENAKEIFSSWTTCEDLAVPLELEPLADRFVGHSVLRERIEIVQVLLRATKPIMEGLQQELNTRIGTLLKKFREAQGVTKQIMAERCGVKVNKISVWEQAVVKITLPEILSVIKRFGGDK